MRFAIPKPPSTNNLYRQVRPRGNQAWTVRAPTAEYEAWKREAGWLIRSQALPLPFFPGPFALSIEIPRKTRMDIDNIKAIPDLLKSLGIVTDDRKMDRLFIERHDRFQEWAIVILDLSLPLFDAPDPHAA